jgi:hypothetical protein
VTCEGRDLQEEAVAIEKHFDALPRQDAAAPEMSAHVFFAAATVGSGERPVDFFERGEIALAIGLVRLGLRIGLRTQDGITLFGDAEAILGGADNPGQPENE